MVFFIFIQVLIEIMQANSGDPDQTPHSHERTQGIWVKMQLFCYLIKVPEIWEVDC